MERTAAVEKERLRIAADLHDDLGARLTKLSLLLDGVGRSFPSRTARSRRLSEILEATRSIEQAVDETIWAVNPKYDSVDGLLAYIEQYAQEFLESTEIRLRLDLPGSPVQGRLTADERHAIFSVVKESLSNTVRHAAATQIGITAGLHGDRLVVTMRDDGRGFIPSNIPEFRQGISGMRNRVQSVGGSINVESSPGRGTTVTVDCRLARES
jgi:signal transduction histidine kinase